MTTITGRSDVSTHSNDELIASNLLVNYDNAAVVLGSLIRRPNVAKGEKSFTLLSTGDFTAADLADEGSITATTLSKAVQQVDLDKEPSVGWQITKGGSIQSVLDEEALGFERATAAIIQKMELDALAAFRAGVSTSAPDHKLQLSGTGNLEINQADIINFRKLLNKQNLPKEDRFLLISPDQEAAMLNISDFVRADAYGNSNIATGEIGRVYGFTVLMSNNVQDTEVFAYHRSCAQWAMQLEMELMSLDQPLKRLTEYSLAGLWNIAVVQDGKYLVHADEVA